MARSLRIAWVGAGPPTQETGGAPGAATDLLQGLTDLSHRIDCFLPGQERALPARLSAAENLTFVWGTGGWRWNAWYSRTRLLAFVSGLLVRAAGSVRLRRELLRRHREQAYDLLLQYSNIESLSVPARMRRSVPLVIMPSTHMAGELRWLWAERQLAFRSEPRYAFFTVAAIRVLRTLVQRVVVRRASLLVCISSVFRDHLVRDYGFPEQRTVVIPYPVRLERFSVSHREPTRPQTVLVLGRIATRKGIENVLEVAGLMAERGIDARVRIVGGPDLSSDYTRLLEDLPSGNAEYAGRIPPDRIPDELARASVLLQAAKYEPFGLTVAEALAAGVPVVATSEVGAIEGVARSVVTEVRPIDVNAMVSAIEATLRTARTRPRELAQEARAEAERLFAREVVCRRLSDALVALVSEAQR